MAGVHKSTVDKVIHNRPGVSDAVRQRIKKLLKETNYQPNRAAQALQYQKRELKLGIVLTQVDALVFLQGGILNGLKEYKEFNIKTTFSAFSMSESEKMAQALRRMAKEQYDGVILCPINAKCVRDALQELAEKKIPVVTVNSDLDDITRLCYVGQDGIKASQTAGRLMTECLGDKSRIAVVTSAIAGENSSYYVKIRETYFIRYMQEHCPETHIVEVIESMENAEITRQKTKELLEREADLDGIYITCGGVADVAEVVRDAGRAGTIKIIGYESYPQIVKLMEQNCIAFTIDSDIPGQGKVAVRCMMQYLLNNKKPKRSEVYTDSRILVQELL